MNDMKGEQVGLVLRGITPEQAREGLVMIQRRKPVEPTIMVAECGCRYKIVSALSKIGTKMYARWELDAICVPHSHERTARIEEQSSKRTKERHGPVRTRDTGSRE